MTFQELDEYIASYKKACEELSAIQSTAVGTLAVAMLEALNTQKFYYRSNN